MEKRNLKVYSDVLNIQMNALMWDYLISFDLIGIIERISDVDWGKAQSELPKSLRSIFPLKWAKTDDKDEIIKRTLDKASELYEIRD